MDVKDDLEGQIKDVKGDMKELKDDIRGLIRLRQSERFTIGLSAEASHGLRQEQTRG